MEEVAGPTPLDKCLLVQKAVTKRRNPLLVIEALEMYDLSSSVYYR